MKCLLWMCKTAIRTNQFRDHINLERIKQRIHTSCIIYYDDNKFDSNKQLFMNCQMVYNIQKC